MTGTRAAPPTVAQVDALAAVWLVAWHHNDADPSDATGRAETAAWTAYCAACTAAGLCRAPSCHRPTPRAFCGPCTDRRLRPRPRR